MSFDQNEVVWSLKEPSETIVAADYAGGILQDEHHFLLFVSSSRPKTLPKCSQNEVNSHHTYTRTPCDTQHFPVSQNHCSQLMYYNR